jgi:putative methylase
MSRAALAIAISKLDVFQHPNPVLEQYPTDSEVAATFLWDAYMRGHIKGKTIVDLGCGTGVLGIGCLLLGAAKVFFVDIDSDALSVAEKNLRKIEDQLPDSFGEVEFFNDDVSSFFTPVDVVVMNPPFGTKDAGRDVQFLDKAFDLAPVVYSMHKSVTKDYIQAYAEKKGFSVIIAQETAFMLKNTMPYHEKHIERIDVVVFGFQRK